MACEWGVRQHARKRLGRNTLSRPYIEKASIDYLDRDAKRAQPFFMSINFMKVHQPNLPDPDYIHKSMSKSKYADSIVEADARIGMSWIRSASLGIDKNTLVFWTTDNGAWQDVYPDAGYTPFRGTKGTVREGGNRVPAIAWCPARSRRNKEPRHRRWSRFHGNFRLHRRGKPAGK